MRRLLALAATFALTLLIASTALGGTSVSDYKDTFQEPGYSGSDGSLEWATDWLESGESDGPESGSVQAVAHDLCPEGSACLYISGSGILSSMGAYRFADTSELDGLKLCYKIRRSNDNGVMVEPPVLHVQVTDNGESWVTKKSYQLDVNDDSYLYESVEIGDFSSPEFGVRFVVNGLLPDLEPVGVFIDYVWVEGHLSSGTTTSTSTTSTSSTSTSSTTAESTTTTAKPDTTTSSSTTTTARDITTTTTARDATTTVGDITTTTTQRETTTTEASLIGPPDGPPTDSGIRQAATGIQASFGTNAYGDVSASGPDVLGVEFEADYTMAAEIIEYSWVWMLGLVLLIATAVVSGMDRRRVGMGSTG